jgi:hypothetical protein
MRIDSFSIQLGQFRLELDCVMALLPRYTTFDNVHMIKTLFSIGFSLIKIVLHLFASDNIISYVCVCVHVLHKLVYFKENKCKTFFRIAASPPTDSVSLY